MFTENNDANQGGGEQEFTNPLDQSFEMQEFDEFDAIPSYEDMGEQPSEEEGAQGGSGEQGEQGDGSDNEPQLKNAFEDLETGKDLNKGQGNENDANDEDMEALIAKLEAKGLKVQKPQENADEKEFNDKLSVAEATINNANAFLSLSDKEVVSEKIKNDLRVQYEQSNRKHLIGSEEFNLELEAELDGVESNPSMLKMYAENVRNNVRNTALAQATKNKEDLIQERTKKIESKIAENDKKLMTAFNGFHTNSFLGMDVSAEMAKESFDYIKSGQLSKEIKQNPELLAKVALYLKHEKTISEKLGAPSYGEGVAAAMKEFDGTDKKSTSPITAAMQNAGASQGGKTRDWSTVLEQDSEKAKGKEAF